MPSASLAVLFRGICHFFPPGGGDWFADGCCAAGCVVCCSFLLVLRTSTLSAGESIGNGMTGAITSVGSLKAFAIWMSARNGAVDVDVQPDRQLRENVVDQPCDQAVRLSERDPVDGQFRRKFASEIAVQPDDHRLVADVAEQIEGDAGREPCRLRADIFQLAARRPGIEAAADDPTAILVEDHRQHAVEGPGDLDALEAQAIDELLRVEVLKLERQPLRARAFRSSAPSREG